MGLNVSLSIAMSGLRAAQNGLDVVSNNISNAGTPNYTRKTLPQQNVVINGGGIGVQTGVVTRNVDKLLQNEILRQESLVQNLTTTEAYLSQINAAHGNPDSAGSISSMLGTLRDSFSNLVDQPDSVSQQSQVVANAVNVAQTFNRLSETVNQTRILAQSEVVQTVENITRNLSLINQINKEIIRIGSAGASTADLEDQQDAAMKSLSQDLGVSYMRKADNTIAVYEAAGNELVNGSASTLTTGMVALGSQSVYPGAIPGILLHSSFATKDVTTSLSGGRLGALITLRDQTLPQYQAQLDELSYNLAARLSDPDTPPAVNLTLFTDQNGAFTTSVTPKVGFAAVMQVNPAIIANPAIVRDGTVAGTTNGNSTSFSGDATVPKNVVDIVFGQPLSFSTSGLGAAGTTSTGLPASQTALSYAADLVSYQGNSWSITSSKLSLASAEHDNLNTKLSNESGVNLDNELSTLIQLQRSYSITAKLISTNQQMFSDLMAI